MKIDELTPEQIETNKRAFISLIKSINREGARIENLLDYLENKSDFFTAPASTQYHSNFKGGLCYHSLNVYKTLLKIVNATFNSQLADDTGISYIDENGLTLDSESLKIVGLLHDISKTNFYEQYTQNKKVYSPKGTKWDEGGKFDWVSVKAYKIKDMNERFIFGTHGQNSEYIVGTFIPLKIEESVAINWHMGGLDGQNLAAEVSTIYNKYPLAVVLHLADTLSTYTTERIE